MWSRLGNVAPLLTYFHQFLQEGDYLVVEGLQPQCTYCFGNGVGLRGICALGS